MKLQKSLILLKPDALDRGIIGEIITRFERVGAKITGLKMLVSKKDTAKKLLNPSLLTGAAPKQIMVDINISDTTELQELSGSRVKPVFGALAYRPGQSMRLEGDSAKFYATFGFAPRITLEEGLRELAKQA